MRIAGKMRIAIEIRIGHSTGEPSGVEWAQQQIIADDTDRRRGAQLYDQLAHVVRGGVVHASHRRATTIKHRQLGPAASNRRQCLKGQRRHPGSKRLGNHGRLLH